MARRGVVVGVCRACRGVGVRVRRGVRGSWGVWWCACVCAGCGFRVCELGACARWRWCVCVARDVSVGWFGGRVVRAW